MAQEEKEGVIRWLRPEFQNPYGEKTAYQMAINLVQEDKPLTEKAPLPKDHTEQLQAVRRALSSFKGRACAAEVATRFIQARPSRISALLDDLVKRSWQERTEISIARNPSYLPMIPGSCADDGRDDYEADEIREGANGGLSLREARDNFEKYGHRPPEGNQERKIHAVQDFAEKIRSLIDLCERLIIAASEDERAGIRNELVEKYREHSGSSGSS
jgi:hypothetical protein